jgi:hypothetical protein
MEVLIAMFIMAIGMLSLLALFPVGAVSMAQALKDDRCASAAAMAENVAIANNVRHDPNVTTAVANPSIAYGTPNSMLVYVDPSLAIATQSTAPFGTALGIMPGISAGIPRVYPSFASSTALADRWFSLPDGITFLDDGTPDKSSGSVDRDRRYSYAYLLRLLPSSSLVQLYVVVYNGRPTGALSTETTLSASGTAGTNSIVVNAKGTTLRRGGWILDTTYNATTAQVQGYFYRVTNLVESSGTTIVEVQSNLIATLNQVTIMDDVAEVFDKGTSWQP